MPRLRLLVPAVIVLAIVAAVAADLVVTRVRARAQSDWLQGKNLSLAPTVKGLKEPTFVAWLPDGSGRMLILERGGRIRLADADGTLHPQSVLDISDNTSTSTEQGLLGIAFDPGYAQNGYVYIDFTDASSSVQVIRYTLNPAQPTQIDPSTASTVLALTKHSKVHNGGTLIFGPDGYLYISVGDDDASDQAQQLGTLFGKILRIDVSSAATSGGQPYAIPPTNPFVDQPGARGEIWSYGLRGGA